MKHLIIIACFLSCIPFSTLAQTSEGNSHFNGIYVGANVGIQNMFSGSFIDGKDILAQESKFVSEILAGYRWQLFEDQFVAGLQVQVGFTDGDLHHEDPPAELFIDYSGSFQYGYGAILGVTVGPSKRLLIFGYINETTRDFDLDIAQEDYRFTQHDEQGMLKYGVGLEYSLVRGLQLRGKFGALDVDFGDAITNIDVEDKYDYTLGVTWQF